MLILEDLGGEVRFFALVIEMKMEIDKQSVLEVYFQSQEYNPCVENKRIRVGFSSSAFGRAEK